MITAVLMAIVPRRALLELMLTGRRLSGGAGSRDLGIVNRVVSPDELDEAVDTVVTDLIGRSPAALALGKQAFYAAADLDFDSALDHLHAGLTAIAMTADAAEGVAAFSEKREPEWRGR